MAAGIDLNMLIYAVDKGNPNHTMSINFLEQIVNSDETIYITWDVIYGFIRITTHPGILSSPFAPVEALSNAQKLIDHPNIEVLSPSKKSWEIFAKLQKELKIRGNLVPDAIIASILEAYEIRKIYTTDRDFWKFPFLKPVNPLNG